MDPARAPPLLTNTLAESGINTEVLLTKSRHKDRRSLDIYARPGSQAVARATATFDQLNHTRLAVRDYTHKKPDDHR